MANPTRFLLDTNILVHWTRGRALGQWIEDKYGLQSSTVPPIICEVTRGEMLSLALQWNWGDKQLKELKRILDFCVEVPISLEGVHVAYAQIDLFSQNPGNGISARNMGKNDLWIAAVAHIIQMPLLCCDHDFDHLSPQWIQLEYIDPDSAKNQTNP